MAVRLTRIGHSRGFGIQSPWAYRFVTGVVCERSPYYLYDELLAAMPCNDKRLLRLCRLYFRMANFFQPQTVVDYGAATDVCRRYIRAGCRKSDIISIGKDDGDGNKTPLADVYNIDMFRMNVVGPWRGYLDEAVKKAHDGSVFVIEGIYDDRTSRRLWKEMVADSRCTLTFDLYDCGIIFFDKKRYKENYTVNI